MLAVFAERRKDSFWSVCPADERHPELSLEGHSEEQNYRHHRTILNQFSVRIFIVSDTLPGTTLPDDNNDRTWWGLPCTVTPCFGARLVQEGNRLHYLADRAGIRGRFSDADSYHLDQTFPLLMKQLELMLTSGELNPRHQHTVTLYAKGLTCEADTLGSCGYVYMAVYPTPETKKVTLQNNLLLRPWCFHHATFPFFISAFQENLQYENITCITRAGGQFTPVSG